MYFRLPLKNYKIRETHMLMRRQREQKSIPSLKKSSVYSRSKLLLIQEEIDYNINIIK